MSEEWKSRAQKPADFCWGTCLGISRGVPEVWARLAYVSFLPHDLVTGGIPHTGSRQVPMRVVRRPLGIPLPSMPGPKTAGSQCEVARPWQGYEEGSWHTQGVLRLQGPLWKFLSMYPNKNLPVFVLCFSTLLTFSGKSQFRALVFCIWKSVSIQKPSDGFLACL